MTLGTAYRNHDTDYLNFRERVSKTKLPTDQPIFVIKTKRELFDVYLDCMPDDVRQKYNCNACRSFLNTYGCLATVSDGGYIEPLFFKDLNESQCGPFAGIADAMYRQVRHGKIVRAYTVGANGELTWGKTFDLDSLNNVKYSHLHYQNPINTVKYVRKYTISHNQGIHNSRLLLSRALAKYSHETVKRAVGFLRVNDTDGKFSPRVKWFKNLYTMGKALQNNRFRSNLIHREAVKAPSGWCHIGNSVVGSLMDDLQDPDVGYSKTIANFKERTAPTEYMRPKGPVKTGNVSVAEDLIKQMGCSKSLKRRYASLDELETLWTPPEDHEQPNDESVFGHLVKGKNETTLVNKNIHPITTSKFLSTVLPEAECVEYMPKHADGFGAVTTAVHSDAPVIMQWGHHVAWYIHSDGAYPYQFNLTDDSFTKVNAIIKKPSAWSTVEHPKFEKHLFFILDGARDLKLREGNALFPEFLINELHPIRRTIEVYSATALLQDAPDDKPTCGVSCSSERGLSGVVRVMVDGMQTLYRIERWD